MSAAGAPKNKGTAPALGRIRGGFSTQIHMLTERRGHPLRLRVTGGQRHDSTQTLVEAWTDTPRSCLITDRAYDGDAFRVWLAQQGIEAVIPARKGRTNPSPTTRNDTRRATPWNAASVGSNGGGAWPPAMTNTRIGAWVFCTWLKSCLNTT